MELWKELWKVKAQLDVVSREMRIGMAIAVAIFISVMASNL